MKKKKGLKDTFRRLKPSLKSLLIIIFFSWRNSLNSETHKSSRGDDSPAFSVVLEASERNKHLKIGGC